ncbi:type II secretion system F family protein [Actinokineospora soli]
MARFTYTAAAPTGEQAEGTLRATDREAAELALHAQGMRRIILAEKPGLLRTEITAPRVKRAEVMHLTRQLGAFIRAGLPLVEAVRVLGDEAGNSSVRKMMRQVEDGLRAGDTLSDCFDAHPKIFPEFYRGILRSAELTGRLDVVLDQLATYLERDLEARRKVKSATIYPGAVAAMSVVTVAVLAGFVLPRFRVFFASLGAELPLPTRMLLAVTDFLSAWWWALLAGIGVLVLAVLVALRTEWGRHTKDRIVLRVPVVGSTIRFALVERFSRILSSMVSAGVSLPEALRVAGESLRNRVYVLAIARVGDALLEGEGLSKPIARTGLFPGTAARMLRVGEETGTLDTQLENTARYYEGELDYKLRRLTALFEPVVIVVMGLVVGFVAIALVSAMYGIFNRVNV